VKDIFFRWSGFLLVVPLLSGCAAIESRNIDGGGRPYIGTRTDAYHVSHPAEADTMGEPIFCAFDLPFSMVIDTVCLPYDVIEKKKTKAFNPQKPVPPPGQ
jgi:uncharacterized protein YceK